MQIWTFYNFSPKCKYMFHVKHKANVPLYAFYFYLYQCFSVRFTPYLRSVLFYLFSVLFFCFCVKTSVFVANKTLVFSDLYVYARVSCRGVPFLATLPPTPLFSKIFFIFFFTPPSPDHQTNYVNILEISKFQTFGFSTEFLCKIRK